MTDYDIDAALAEIDEREAKRKARLEPEQDDVMIKALNRAFGEAHAKAVRMAKHEIRTFKC